jgi:RimJ/RimL family protein N-acetyltransferase
MSASLQPAAAYTAREGWAVPIRTPGASPDRFARDDIFTFVRALPSDIVTIDAMFRRCSVLSRQRRFLRPVPSAPRGYLEEVLADRDNHHAFILQRNGDAIGLAELHLTRPWSGDLGLIVEDRFQARGIGNAALELLLCRAHDLGLRMLTADVHFENAVVLRALRQVGSVSMSRVYDVLHVELDLESAMNQEVASCLCAG